jgi:succinate dehydrogenase / fumarate reductase membrane anchor subunit
VSRVRSAGSAHAGVAEWLLQRVTSLYMGGFVIYAIMHLSLLPVRDYTAWKAWFATGYVRIAWALFIASILIHAWVGMRSIYLDYLHPLWLRFSVTLITALGLLALALWAAQILISATP